METETIDAKTAEESSPSADATATSSVEQTPKAEPAQVQSIASVAKQAFDQAASQPAPEGDVPKEDKTEGEEEAEETEEPAEVETEESEDADEPSDKTLPPFHEHPRWKQKEKEAADNAAKATTAESKLKEYEPMVNAQRYHEEFCRQYDISPDDVASMMTILALQKSDPAKAREALKPLWEGLSQFDENMLPADLQKQLDEVKEDLEQGTISATRATAFEKSIREQARLRAQTRNGEHRTRVTAEQQARQTQSQMTGALVQWDNSTRAKNPDFKPKADPAKPDGLWELTAKGFSFLMSTQPPRTPADAVRLVDQAYNDAKLLFTSRLAPKPTPKGLSTSHSSTKTRKEPGTIQEVVAAEARKHGLTYVPNAS